MGMPDSEATGPRTPGVVGWAYRIVNGIFVGAMLSVIAFWVMEGLGKDTLNSTAAWVTAYALVFGLMVALVLVVVLLVHAVAAGTTAFLKWPFVLFVLTVLSLSVNEVVYDRLGGRDTVRLHLLNESGGTITWLDVFGRGESVRIDSIPDASRVVVSYRGRKINYRTRDEFSNRIGVNWVAAGRQRERILVDQWTVIPDSLIIVFPAPDSVLLASDRAAEITK